LRGLARNAVRLVAEFGTGAGCLRRSVQEGESGWNISIAEFCSGTPLQHSLAERQAIDVFPGEQIPGAPIAGCPEPFTTSAAGA